ncbi:MAG: DUF3187 family protein [Nitrospirae bacterium]|nr:DUF3187 family protein [Nitrospirota bacterium]
MRKICGAVALFILSLILPFSAAYSFEGPLQVNNLYPLFLHADQPCLEKAAPESSMSYSLSHSSTYTVENSKDWVINLDMEITELNFRYKRMIKDIVEFDMDIPVLIIGGGFMDGFLEGYHDTFGFPDYGRSQRPHNEFLYEVKRDGKAIIDGKSGTNIGDVRLALKRSLISPDGFGLSVKGDVELPTGHAKTGYGSGSVDGGIAFLLDKKFTDGIMTYWNLGAVFPGAVRGEEKIGLKNFIYGGAAAEAALGESLNFLIQLQGQSAIYPETDISAVDREAWLLVLGGRYKTGKRSFELSLTEDVNTSGAPDFILNLTYKMKL